MPASIRKSEHPGAERGGLARFGAGSAAREGEAIPKPAGIQPHGALLVLEPETLRIIQAAAGDPALGLAGMLGRPAFEALPDAAEILRGLAARLLPSGNVHLGTVRRGAARFHLIGHRADGLPILELEAAHGEEGPAEAGVYPLVSEFLASVQGAASIEALLALAARQVRVLTGLDRVLVYRFDASGNGEVVAEDGNGVLPSYRGRLLPAADIPQARDLCRLNRVRLIADAGQIPVPIEPEVNPLTGKPADLSFAVLRGAPPAQLDAMRRRGTMASLSIALLRDRQLWGLISCHHRAPARVPYPVRVACDFIGQVLSIQIAEKEASARVERRNALREIEARLLARMAASGHFAAGLAADPGELLGLTGAAGAAILADGACTRVGDCPPEADIRAIAAWLAAARRGDVFATDSLAAEMENGARFKDRASGLLAISISQLHDSYLLWFRPEAVRRLFRDGVPEDETPHPGGVSAAREETARMRARPWAAEEVEAAASLRNAIVDIVLRRAEEMAALTERLTAINKELEAFSYSVSHDLRAPFRHIVGYAQLLKKFEGERLSERGNRFIDTIVESAISAGKLVDDLLSHSRVARATLKPVPVDMNALVAEVRQRLPMEPGRRVEWRIADLPTACGDPVMLRLVLQNLLENAWKFTRGRDPAVIEVDGSRGEGETVYRVRDNGAGFDMAYVGKMFGVFQRFHRIEEFGGSGIGLANVKRAIERHGGRVWAEGKVNEGASFYFSLPDAAGDEGA